MLATGLTHSLGVVLPPLTDRENISQPFYMENSKQQSMKKLVVILRSLVIATGATLEELVKQVELMHRQKTGRWLYNPLFRKERSC